MMSLIILWLCDNWFKLGMDSGVWVLG
jgi:hypothetical protein